MKQNVVVLMITGTVDPRVSMKELKEFVADAVSTWGGQFHPDDPLFSSMEVTSVNAQKIGTIDR